MKEFKDINGKIWQVRITLGACKYVKDQTGFDMLHPEAPQGEEPIGFLERISTDSFFDLKLIILLSKQSIRENGYQDYAEDELLDLFDGATYQAASKAFYEEYQNFFRTIGKEQLALYIEKVLEIVNYQNELVDAKLKSIDTKEIVESAITQSGGI